MVSLSQAVVQAPSAMNLQSWSFVVLKDKELLQATYSDCAKQLCADAFKMQAKKHSLKEMLSDPAFNVMYNSGTLIVICAQRVGQHPDGDCCLDAENLMLAAHDSGLGTCPIGLAWPPFKQADVKNELNVPGDFLAGMPIIVCYPRRPSPPVDRKEPDVRYRSSPTACEAFF